MAPSLMISNLGDITLFAVAKHAFGKGAPCVKGPLMNNLERFMSSLASAESSNESFPSLLVEATTRFFGLGLQTKVGTRLLIGKISPEFLFYF